MVLLTTIVGTMHRIVLGVMLAVQLLLTGCGSKTKPIEYSASLDGISTVVLRLARADSARIVRSGTQDSILVLAVPKGGAKGYHSSDPLWEETSAPDWGLGLVDTAYGSVLVVSSVREILYIHHHYYLDQIEVYVPDHVEVVLERRELSGEESTDLSRPSVLPSKRNKGPD